MSIFGFAKQNSEIAELRQECAELRHANANLERQVREGMQVSLFHSVDASGLFLHFLAFAWMLALPDPERML